MRSTGAHSYLLEPESNGTSKASKLVSLKKRIDLIREKGCLVFGQPLIRSTYFPEVSNETKDQDS